MNITTVKPTLTREATKEALKYWQRKVAYHLSEEKIVTVLTLFMTESQNLVVKYET